MTQAELTASGKVGSYWDEYVQRRLSSETNGNRAEWLGGHPLVQARHERPHNDQSLMQWLITEFLPEPVERVAGLGAGTGSFEVDLVAAGAARSADLYELSSGAIAVGEQRAQELGLSDRIHFFPADVNNVDLAPETYSLVTFVSSLHHVSDLDGVLSGVRAALRPGGRWFATEYVGPNRFAFPEAHTRIQSALYDVLDPELRCGEPALPIPKADEVASVDPSEAVRSEEILPALHRYFSRVEVLPRGGGIPFVTCWGLNHDALYDTAKEMRLVDLLLRLDDAPLAAGSIPTYFVDVVAEP